MLTAFFIITRPRHSGLTPIICPSYPLVISLSLIMFLYLPRTHLNY